MSLELHLKPTMKLENKRAFFFFFCNSYRISKLKHKIHFEVTTIGHDWSWSYVQVLYDFNTRIHYGKMKRKDSRVNTTDG